MINLLINYIANKKIFFYPSTLIKLLTKKGFLNAIATGDSPLNPLLLIAITISSITKIVVAL
jgi:hypothetical protein